MARSVAYGTLPGDSLADEGFAIGVWVDGSPTAFQAWTFWFNLWQGVANQIPVEVVLQGVRMVMTESAPAYDIYEDPSGGVGGPVGTQVVPSFCCAAITLAADMAGADRPKNRFYLPATAMSLNAPETNLINAGAVTGILNAVTQAFTDADIEPVVHWKGADYPVTSISMDNVVDTQRRRKFQTRGTRTTRQYPA